MVRGRFLVPRFSIHQFSHRDQLSKQPLHQLPVSHKFFNCERQLSSSGVFAQRGQQRREDRDARQELSAATILEDEKRGVFRVVNISPLKREERKRFKRFGEDDPVPPPRAASMLPTQRCANHIERVDLISDPLHLGGEMSGLQQELFTLQLFLFRSVLQSVFIIYNGQIFLLKVRQGVVQTKQQTQPGKYANTELMKVGC